MLLVRRVTLLVSLLAVAVVLPQAANAAGGPDTSFATIGARAYGAANVDENGSSVAVAPGGKLVVGGDDDNAGFVTRLLADGTPDSSFSGDGTFDGSDYAGRFYGAPDLAVQPDGKVLVPTQDYNGGNRLVGVMRLTDTGALDTSFDGDGFALIGVNGVDFSVSNTGMKVALRPDGTVVVAARYSRVVGASYEYGIAVLRFTSAGAPDTTWSGDGVGLAPTGNPYSDIGGLALDGDRVVVGTQLTRGNTSGNDWAYVRFAANGDAEAVGGPGVTVKRVALSAVLTDGITTGFPSGVIVLADHRIVIGGSVTQRTGTGPYNSTSGLGVIRVTEAGDPDASFNLGKLQFVPGGSGTSLALHGPTNSYLVGTADSGNDTAMGVERIAADGSIDLGWGTNGLAVDQLPTTGYSYAWDVAVQPDGRVVVAGYDIDNAGDHQMAVARFLAESPAPPVPPTPPVTDRDGDGIVDGDDCAPDASWAPAKHEIDANCNGVADTVEAELARLKAETTAKLEKLRTQFANNTKASTQVSKTLPPKLPAANLMSKKGAKVPVALPDPGVIIVQTSVEVRANGVIAAGGGNVIAAGGGNVIAAGGGNVIAAGGGNVVASGGGNLVNFDVGRSFKAKKPKVRQVLLAGGGRTFAAAGKGAIQLKPTTAGRALIKAWRAKAAKAKRHGKKVAPLRIRITTIVGPLEAGTSSAVYTTKVITLTS